MVAIPEEEYQLTFSRAGGPGGQNVNKVSTKVTLKWNYLESGVLTEEEKQRVAASPLTRNRINNRDEIVLQEASSRTQLQNKEEVVRKLNELVAEALKVNAKRRKTRVPRGKKEARLQDKRITKKRKELRRKVDQD